MDGIKLLTPQERDEFGREIARPMRTTKRAEQIARRTVLTAIDEHKKWFTQLLRILPTPPRHTVWKDSDSAVYIQKDVHVLGCGCPIHKEVQQATKQTTEEEFIELVGADANRKIIEASQQFTLNVYGSTDAINSDSPYKKGLLDIIEDSFNWAFAKVEKARPKHAKEITKQSLSLFPPSNFDWVQQIFTNGFTLVKSITEGSIPMIRTDVVGWLTQDEPLSWTEIASGLNSKYGQGDLWRWQRLIRTEMAQATNRAIMEQYNSEEVPFIRWDAAHGHCPICGAIQDSTGIWADKGTRGYYKFDSAPNIWDNTHPNCRCLQNPIFDPPREVLEFFG